MLDLMYEHEGKFVITGCKYLHDAKFIGIREYDDMIRISAVTDMDHPDSFYYFSGLTDPDLKEYMLEYFKRKEIRGVQLVELDQVYYEMVVEGQAPIEQAIEEAKQYFTEDADNFRIYIL